MNRRVHQSSALKYAGLASVVAVIAAGMAVPAAATNGIKNAFNARYPGSTLMARTRAATGSDCYVCHHPSSTSNPGNCYKDAIALRIAAGRTSAQAIADVEAMDSDGDGFTNVEEILLARADMPGEVGYNPGLIGDTGTDPCGTNTTAPVTNQPETPPASCPADFNGDGFVSGDDFDLYVAAFELGDPSADFNGDGFVSGDDFDAFVLAFEAGC